MSGESASDPVELTRRLSEAEASQTSGATACPDAGEARADAERLAESRR